MTKSRNAIFEAKELVPSDGKYYLLGYGLVYNHGGSIRINATFVKKISANHDLDSIKSFAFKKEGENKNSYCVENKLIPIEEVSGCIPGSFFSSQGIVLAAKNYAVKKRLNLRNLNKWDEFYGRLKNKLRLVKYLPGSVSGARKFDLQYAQVLKRGIHFDDVDFEEVIIPAYVIFKHFFSGSKYFTEAILNFGIMEDDLIRSVEYSAEDKVLKIIVGDHCELADLEKVIQLQLFRNAKLIAKTICNNFLKEKANFGNAYIKARLPEENCEMEFVGKKCYVERNKKELPCLFVYDILGSKASKEFPRILWNRHRDTRRANKEGASERKPYHSKTKDVNDNSRSELRDLSDYDPYLGNQEFLAPHKSTLKTNFNITREPKLKQKTKGSSFGGGEKTKKGNSFGGLREQESDNGLGHIVDHHESDTENSFMESFVKDILNFTKKLKCSVDGLEIQFIKNTTGDRIKLDSGTNILSEFYTDRLKLIMLKNNISLKNKKWCFFYSRKYGERFKRKVAVIELKLNGKFAYIFDSGYKTRESKTRLLMVYNLDGFKRIELETINLILLFGANKKGVWSLDESSLFSGLQGLKFNHNSSLITRITKELQTLM